MLTCFDDFQMPISKEDKENIKKYNRDKGSLVELITREHVDIYLKKNNLGKVLRLDDIPYFLKVPIKIKENQNSGGFEILNKQTQESCEYDILAQIKENIYSIEVKSKTLKKLKEQIENQYKFGRKTFKNFQGSGLIVVYAKSNISNSGNIKSLNHRLGDKFSLIYPHI